MTDDRPIAGPPSITRGGFVALLEPAGSPAAPEAGAMYDALVRRGVDPLVFLAFFNHESGFGLQGVAARHDTRNPGNVRSIQNPEHGGVVIPTERGPFVRYASWLLGTQDWADRLRGEKYEGEGRRTVRQVLPKYAPVGDDNDPDAYARSVLAFVERHREDRPMPDPIVDGLIDIRDDLARNPAGGPNDQFPAGEKTWAVVHYFGPAVDQAKEPIAYFTSIAHTHAFVRNWGTPAKPLKGDGIMYHIGIVPDGRVYLLRSLDDVLWHCGAAQNTTGFAVHCMLGGSQRASAAMLLSLRRVIDALVAATVPRDHVIGHVELGTTGSCPGTLMPDFVLPYRQGGHAGTDALLDREYARCGGAAMLGAHVVKAHLDWTVDWGAIDHDVLICERGVVSVAPTQTETAQKMFVDRAREALTADGVLTTYG